MSSEKIEKLQEMRARLEVSASEEKIAEQHKNGKLTARERVALLLDPGSFIELDAFAEHRSVEDGVALGDGVVTGQGTIDGRAVYIFAQDFTVMSGSLGEMHAKKICRVQDLAVKTGAPVIGIYDSGGVRVDEGVDALAGYGSVLSRSAKASGIIPQISVVMGNCAGCAVFSPALSDFTFMVENTSKMFVSGPLVIKAATGSEVSLEELGGAQTHNVVSGVAHFKDISEEACVARVKTLLSFLPSNNLEKTPRVNTYDEWNRIDERLDMIIDNQSGEGYDIYEIIKSVADDGFIFEVKSLYATNIITAFIRVGERSVGVVANQPSVRAGCLDIDAADKAAEFIRICDSFNIPILTFVDTPGFVNDEEQERAGVIRHGAKLMYAYAEASVPKVTIIIRRAYAAGYVAMCSKEMGADMVFAWPTAEISITVPEGVVNIIYQNEIEAAQAPSTVRSQKIAEYKENYASPYMAAKRGYVDDIIIPMTTRQRIIGAFEALAGKREVSIGRKHGNIPL